MARMYTRSIVVRYPLEAGHIVLRTADNWHTDVEPDHVSADGSAFVFQLESPRPWLYFKPLIRRGDRVTWARGSNRLAILTGDGPQAHYPYFRSSAEGSFAPLVQFRSALLARNHKARVYLPPGYSENRLKRYPVVYMQDGQNLFFPEEAFQGNEWHVDEAVAALDAMSLIDKVIVVGLYSGEREAEYTRPGYESYGRAVVDELKPAVDAGFRSLSDPAHTMVVGSSLGGVVSFFMAWQWPDVFSTAGCLSSTFGLRDNLVERVLSEEPRNVRIYLGSGWPEDNYEATLSMAMALISRGWEPGRNLVHVAFPGARHHEEAWTARLPLLLQMFSGKLRTAWLAEQGGLMRRADRL